MTLFASEQEVYETLGRLFQELMDDPELGERFRQADTIVRYEYTEPDSVITVMLRDTDGDRVILGETDVEPEVTMMMSADTAHRFWLGEVNVTVALARGQIKAKGPVAKILKLVPLAKPAFPRYAAQLEEQGRGDLADV